MPKLKLLQSLSLSLLSLIIVGCNSSPSSNQVVGSSLITIDNAGVIPIIDGTQTTSVIYVHNNSNVDITNISYTSSNNSNSNEDNFLNPASVTACKTIKAGQSCPLEFTTPKISTTTAQGSTLINLSYNFEGSINSFNRVLNYAIITNIKSDGALFNSNLVLNSSGNKTEYGVVYLYSSGENQDYLINSMTSNKTLVKITQGNLTNKQIQSNMIQAVEISAITDTLNTNYQATVTVTSSSNNNVNKKHSTQKSLNLSNQAQSYTSSANVSIIPATNGAILTTSQVPLINTAVSNPSGKMYVLNSGNAEASLDLNNITYPNGVSSASGNNQCNSSLAAGVGCYIYFDLTQGSNGSGNISIPYTTPSGGNSGTLAQTITWYNDTGAALLSMNSSMNPINFTQTQSASTTITVNNIGGYNLSNITPSATVTKSASALISGLACFDANRVSTGTNLPIGGSCTYSMSITDDVIESGYATTTISGSYDSNQIYSRILTTSYNSQQLSVSISTPTTIVHIDGESPTYAVINLNNASEITTPIIININSNQPNAMSVSPATCSLSSANESCTITLTGLNPSTTANFKVMVNSNLLATSAIMTVRYPIAYITNYTDPVNGGGLGKSYVQCTVGANGIESNTCSLVTPQTTGGPLHGPCQIIIYQGFAYMVNYNGDSYTQCSVNDAGIESNTCVTHTPGLSYPNGIAASGQYMYISNAGTNAYTRCAINSNGINEASCTTQALPGSNAPDMITINGNYIYFPNYNSPSYVQCTLDQTGLLDSSTCQTITPNGPLNTPYNVTFNANFAYFTNSTETFGNYTQCNVVDNLINPTSCVNVPLLSPQLNYPTGINIYNNIAYFLNQGTNDLSGVTYSTYTQCNVTANGIEPSSCTQIYMSKDMLSEPQSMVIY